MCSWIRLLRTRGRWLGVVVLFVACQAEDAQRPEVSKSSAAAPVPAAASPEPSFTTSAACRGCHPKAYEKWQGSDHDRAMELPSETSVIGDFNDASFESFGVEWRFFRRGESFFVHTAGPDGIPADFEIAYTFGVDPLQQYLVELQGGRLQALTVAWDSRPKQQGGQHWFSLHADEPTPPGDVLHWAEVGNRWNLNCAHCHSTNLRKNYSLARDVYQSTWSEIDVACEACHGPGSTHVAWAEGGGPGDEPNGLTTHLGSEPDATWVMDDATGIARRDPVRVDHSEVASCAGCHSRRSLLSEDPAGDETLDNIRPSLLHEGLYFADGQINDEVYVYGSFLQSRMHAAGVVCSDCHDPHSQELRASGGDLCARCHAPARFATSDHHHHSQESPGARCVSCHMPSRRYMTVDDRRDHSFRVPRPDLTLELGTPNACSGCHTAQSPVWAAERVAAWFPQGRQHRPHYAQALHAGQLGAPGARHALEELAANGDAPGIARATAIELLARYPSVSAGKAIEQAAKDPDPLIRMAAAQASESLAPATRLDRIGALLEDPVRAVRIEAARSLASVPREQLSPAQQRVRQRGLVEYRRAQELQSDQPGAHVNLGLLASALGEPTVAERSYRRAISVGSYFVPAYINLADLYRVLARDAEGEQVLREGTARIPESAALHHSLGLALVRLERSDEALASLQRASELGGEPRFDYVFGVALHSFGQTDRALKVLGAAHEQYASDVPILEALIALSRDAGHLGQARAWAQKLEALSPTN